jgi:hypothetical protein
MKDAQKPDHVSLNTLITRLKEGRFVIPDFQREFEWKPWDIQDLMRSIFLDYYIGSLLLWKGKEGNFDALSCEAIYGFEGEDNRESIVLDGQQRLTAIYYAFMAPEVNLPNRARQGIYYIRVDKFRAEEFDEAFRYDWMSRHWGRILKDQSLQFSGHIFPLSVIGAGGWDLGDWFKGYEKYWQDQAAEITSSGTEKELEEIQQHIAYTKEFGLYVKELIEQYQISYIELDREISVDKVCDIFTQINSRGVRLDAFDLINALLKPKGLQLKHMWRAAASRLEFVDTPKMNVYILQVMSILRQAYCSPKYLYFLLPGQERPIRDPDGTRRTEVMVKDAVDFENRWHNAVLALENAIKLLRDPREFGAISSSYLPYISILPAFSSLQFHVNSLSPELHLTAQRKVRHWYWASVFTNRYSGSVESTSARDFLDVQAWITDDDEEPALIGEFRDRFNRLDLRGETRRGTSVYSGIFNLLILKGAQDWYSGKVPQHSDLDDHHIVPKSWQNPNLKGKIIDSILNRTPLSAETNRRVIKERLPNEYLPELIAANGEGSVRAILESHFISPTAFDILLRDPFSYDDYEEFITERQRTIQDAIQSLLIKERLDLPLHLRDLDEKIELIELDLRITILDALDNDLIKVPSHILVEVDKRVQRTLRKNASLDSTQYETLDGKLEYFDLRELQNTITNRALWPQFEPRFVNKVSLDQKFDQLAELRNGIRHSRTVDEITQKEGEAAILWFRKVLDK